MIFEYYLESFKEIESFNPIGCGLEDKENANNRNKSGGKVHPRIRIVDTNGNETMSFGEVFLLLSKFFGEDSRVFVENNMLYIYPLNYPLPFLFQISF